MSKVEEIRSRILSARKNRAEPRLKNEAMVLSTLLAETKTDVLKKENREITDRDLELTAKRFLKNLRTSLEYEQKSSASDGVIEGALKFEISVISDFAPEEPTKSDKSISEIVQELMSTNPEQKNPKWFVGQVMKAKQGDADPKEVIKIVEASIA